MREALVLLHGWGMTPGVFGGLASALQSTRDVHAIALPGYAARAARDPYTLDSLADDVAEAAPQCCVVAGWSFGAQIALRWARTRPSQVQALALIAATPSFAQRPGWKHAIEAEVLQAFVRGLDSDREATLKRFASLQAQGDAQMKTVALALREHLAADSAASTQTLQRGLSVLLQSDLRDELGEIEQNALVIHGEHDRLTPLAAGEHLAGALKRGTLLTIAGAAHAPFLSEPGAVACAIEEFLR
jgi:pimeloyl-[acyl-carrier protein] methyl ester esterase